VFVVMLAYLIELELRKAWREFDLTVSEGLEILSGICAVEIESNGVKLERIIKPNKMIIS